MTIHHTISGPEGGHVVVLVGSLGTTLAMWDPQVRELSTTYRVVAVDLPGHGGTPIPSPTCTVDGFAADVVALIDRLDTRRFSVVGLSFGGAVAQAIGANHPHRVASLVVACSAPSFAEKFWRDRAATVRRDGLAQIIELTTDRRFTEDFRRDEPQLAARSLAQLTGMDPAGYAACCDALAGFTSPVATEISAPTLVVAGELDEVTPRHLGIELAALIPDARLEVIQGAAHLASVERPDAFTAVARRHLAMTSTHNAS